jgi:hypothetical protein
MLALRVLRRSFAFQIGAAAAVWRGAPTNVRIVAAAVNKIARSSGARQIVSDRIAYQEVRLR